MNETGSTAIGHYGVVLRRQWKTIVAATLLGVLVMIAFLLIAQPKVTASTLVNVNVIVADPFNPSRPASGLLDASTEDQLASSYVVAKEAAKTLPGGDTAAELREGASVATGADATTVRISYTSSSAERARAGADAIANSYLSYRQSQADARKTRMLDQLAQQLAALNKARLTGTAERSTLTTRISNVEFQINQLTAIDTTGGAIITPASENRVVEQRATLLASGLLVGLVVGIILAFVFNAMGRRVRDVYDVDRAGAGPVLAELRGTQATFPASEEDLDDYRMIRERLLAAASGSAVAALTIIDDTHGQQSSDVAPNLAVAFAQVGTDVELVVMGASEDYMDLLSQGLQLSPISPDRGTVVFTSGRVPGLRVVQPPTGAVDRGADLYLTASVRNRVRDSAPESVIILALPVNAPQASILAASRLSGAAVLVVESQESRIRELARSAERVRDVNAVVLGTALVPHGRRICKPNEEPRADGYKHLERESLKS